MHHLIGRQLTCGLIVVNTDPVKLQVAVSMVSSCGIDAVLIADHFPELQTENRRYHMAVTCKEKKKVRICLLAMWLWTLNEKNSRGFAFLESE